MAILKYTRIIAGSNEETICDIPMPPKDEKQSLLTRQTKKAKQMIKRTLQYIKDLFKRKTIFDRAHEIANIIIEGKPLTYKRYEGPLIDTQTGKVIKEVKETLLPSDLIMGMQSNLIAEIKYVLDNGTGKTHKINLIEQAFQKYESALNNQ